VDSEKVITKYLLNGESGRIELVYTTMGSVLSFAVRRDTVCLSVELCFFILDHVVTERWYWTILVIRSRKQILVIIVVVFSKIK
jgi:hypothetical protein